MVQLGAGADAHAPDQGSAAQVDDAALVAAAQAEPEQFALLYERYVGPIYRYCYVQLGSRAAAEDATSEVFMKAFAALPRFRGGSVPGWLLRIARNTVIDAYRRRRPVQALEDADDVAVSAPTPEDAAVANAERRALRAALAELPDPQRSAVVLQLASWSGEQIAAALGKSPAAVYMLRVRALARLAKRLRAGGWHQKDSAHG